MGLDISLVKKEYLVDMNITHNLVPMWKKAGIYDALYNSEGTEIAKEVYKAKEVLINEKKNKEKDR